MNPRRKFMAVCLLPYQDGVGFFDRNCGLLAQSLRTAGADAWFVAYGDPARPAAPPLLLARPEDLRAPEWWKAQGANAVYLASFATPGHEAIASAIRASGARLALSLDSDGILSPRGWPLKFALAAYESFRDQRRAFALLRAVLKTAAFTFLSSAWHDRVIRAVEGADMLAVETPLARQRVLALLRMLRRPDLASRVRFVPHPVPDSLGLVDVSSKKPVILSVGRWHAYQKNAPLLMRALARALECHPGVAARIVGPGHDRMIALASTCPASVRARIDIRGPVPFSTLEAMYAEAQVLFLASRFESFHLAAAEALCAGCSVAGPPHLPSLPWFCSRDSGTTACGGSARDLEHALCEEIQAWSEGRRNPAEISSHWRRQLLASHVAQKLLALLDIEP